MEKEHFRHELELNGGVEASDAAKLFVSFTENIPLGKVQRENGFFTSKKAILT